MTPEQYQIMLSSLASFQTSLAVLQARMDIVILWLTGLTSVLSLVGIGAVTKELLQRNGRGKP